MIMFKIAESANYGPHLIANVSHYVFGSMTSSYFFCLAFSYFFGLVVMEWFHSFKVLSSLDVGFGML